METVGFILYVANQARSMEFYKKLLKTSPSLNEPGMTEFNLSETVKLGLMPESGISNIICPAMPHPKNANGIPRCELYLKVKNPRRLYATGNPIGRKKYQ
jgi:hypothetical protein